jgi:kynurenine 3-monooxygenase
LILAEQAEPNFSRAKNLDVTLSEATLHIGERGAKKRNMIVLVLMSRIRHRMQRQSMFNYSQEFKYWLQGTKYSRKSRWFP